MADLGATLGDEGPPPPLLACPRCGSTYTSHTHRCGIDGEPLVRPTEDFLIGRTIDRYRILERIGVGAMGCVYRASHVELDNVVAIKVLLGELGSDERFVARFRREAQILHRTAHPNVVRVLDFGHSPEGLPYMVMELVEGRTLESLIITDAPLSPATVRTICRGLLSGLAAIHDAGFVHRDVKPANVMVGSTVKLLDFGIAGMVDATKGTKLTATGKILGTPTYMAPEQAEESEVEPTADLYSVGAIMFEMLSGKPPFVGQRLGEVLVKHATLAPPSLPTADGLELIVEQLLQKRPEDRPQTAGEVLELLTLKSPPRLATDAPHRKLGRWSLGVSAAVASLSVAWLLSRSLGPDAEPVEAATAAIAPSTASVEPPTILQPTPATVVITEPGPVGPRPKVEPMQPPIPAGGLGAKAGRHQAPAPRVDRLERVDHVETSVLRAMLDRTLRALQAASSRLTPAKLATLEERALAAGEEVARGVDADRSVSLAQEIAAIERELNR